MPQRIEGEPPVMLRSGIAQRTRGRRDGEALQARDHDHGAGAHQQLRQSEIDHDGPALRPPHTAGPRINYFLRLMACWALGSAGSSLSPGLKPFSPRI